MHLFSLQCYNYLCIIFATTYILHIKLIALYKFLVPTPNITIIPNDPIQGAMVGSPQDIQCIVSTVSGLELSSVMISWMGPGGKPITNNILSNASSGSGEYNDTRVTISPTTSSGNNYTSSIQFTYLMEGDEGMYTCDVTILEANNSMSLELLYLTGKPLFVTT